jgi:hypothetical protein
MNDMQKQAARKNLDGPQDTANLKNPKWLEQPALLGGLQPLQEGLHPSCVLGWRKRQRLRLDCSSAITSMGEGSRCFTIWQVLLPRSHYCSRHTEATRFSRICSKICWWFLNSVPGA